MWSKLNEVYNNIYKMCKGTRVQMWNPTDFICNNHPCNNRYCVIILNQPIASTFKKEFIWNLWSQASLRITVDGGTECWLSWLKVNDYSCSKGMEPDFITGDMDSISQETIRYFTKRCEKVQVVKTPDQDETDFTKALRVVQQYKIKENTNIDIVLVLVENSGRLDQIIANINTLFKAREILSNTKIIILSCGSLTWLLNEDVVHTINIPLSLQKSKEWCALIPIGSPCLVTSTGLKWNLSNTLLEFGKVVSTSNTYNGEPNVTVQATSPVLWSMGIENLLKLL